jgi:hypothetical protein
MVADLDGLAQQSAGIIAQIEDQPMQIAEAVDGVDNLLRGGLLELFEMNVADARPNLIFKVP